MSEKKLTHRYVAFRDGEQVMCWDDDGTLATESVVQMMRDSGVLVIRQRIPEVASA